MKREQENFDAGFDAERFDPAEEFGELNDRMRSGLSAKMPDSLLAESLFVRFEGLLGETPGAPDKPEMRAGTEAKAAAAMDAGSRTEAANEAEETSTDRSTVVEFPRKRVGAAAWMSKALAAAACLAITAVAVSQMGKEKVSQEGIKPPAPLSASSSVAEGQGQEVLPGAAVDYSELRSTIYAIQKKMGYYPEYTVYEDGSSISKSSPQAEESRQSNTAGGMAEPDFAMDAAEAEMAPAPSNPATAGAGMMAGGASSSRNVYSTNTQEAGIDEADIIKTDGKYLYVYRYNQKSATHEISIIEASTLKQLSTIDIGGRAFDGSLYLDGDYMTLVRTLGDSSDITYGTAARSTVGSMAANVDFALGSTAGSAAGKMVQEGRAVAVDIAPVMPGQGSIYGGGNNVVEVTVYDIKDKKAPSEIESYLQDGNLLTSRYMNGVVYAVTNKGVWSQVNYNDMPMSYIAPLVGRAGEMDIMPVSNVIISPYLASPNYVTVTATNVRTGESTAQSVLGVADTIYMSSEALYITAVSYDYNRTAESKNQNTSYNTTGIVKIEVDGTALNYSHSTQIDGVVDGQFAFSEKDGFLRVATTADTPNGSINGLYVLDEELKTVGTVNNLAPGERIYSVRYVGDMGYVVTFKQVDPLFAIDLSDPKNPQVIGELKIPGFSEYLHPIDSSTLLGFGYNTVENQWGGVTTDGLKLSFFDVSDPANPVETQSYSIGNSGSSSPAISNHKAFMYYPERNIVGIPTTVYTSSAAGYGGETFSGLLLFEIGKDGFKLYGQIASRSSDGEGFGRYDSRYEISRGVYIGDIIYTFSDGCVMSHRLRQGMPKISEFVFES